MSTSTFNTLSSPSHSMKDLVQATKTTKHHSLSIPPELIEEIIDYLWDDKDALIACSFVCRLFYLRTRVHLLHSIELKHTPDDLFSQSVLPYIKNITIRRGSDIPSLIPFLSSLPNLTALHLDRFQFPDPWSLHRLICQLPGLTSLQLSAIRFRQDFLVELGSVGGLLPKINKISMWGTSFRASVVEFLIHQRELRAVYADSLRELCIMYPPGEYLSSICAFVRAASRSLRSLDIRIRRVMYRINIMSGWPAQLDVLPLTMPTLKIEMECSQRSSWHIKVMRWLLDSLTGADGPIMMKTLLLVVVPPSLFDGLTMDDDDWVRQWSRLDEILTGPDMKAFQWLKVTFNPHADYPSSWEGSHFIEWVHETLPLMEKRNMLDVDIVEDTG